MKNFLHKLQIITKEKALWSRILFVLGIFVAFRLLSAIPVPGISTFELQQFLNSNQFFGFLNLFSGGGLSQLSLVMLGVGPYITASVIMQLLTIMSPKLKSMYQEEGEIGRKKFNRYSRFLTVPIALIQGASLLTVLAKQGVIVAPSMIMIAFYALMVMAGSFLAVWLGELISEYGIGNGVSVIIFAGIVASIPAQLNQLVFLYDPSQLLTYIAVIILALVVITAVVLVTEAERPVPVTYSKQARGGNVYGGTSSYIPLRINQAGVMPIIFAVSILMLPQFVAQLLANSANATALAISNGISWFLNNGWLYAAVYFVFVFVFTFFYTAITFDPQAMSNNLHKGGAFIPGVRPGTATEEYLGKIVTRTTFFGAFFLATIAVLPIILQTITGIQALAIGGTGILIVVSVLIDIMKKLDAQISMREY